MTLCSNIGRISLKWFLICNDRQIHTYIHLSISLSLSLSLSFYIYAIMKTVCPPGYHHNGFVTIHEHGHIMYGYTLLVPMNQRLLNKLSKERNISVHKWSTTQDSGGHIIFIITYTLLPSCFCEIWALCVSWIIYDHLYICDERQNLSRDTLLRRCLSYTLFLQTWTL